MSDKIATRDAYGKILLEMGEKYPDLVVLDVSMPELNGLAVFGELMKDPVTREIRVIMLTGVSEKTGIDYSPEDMGWFFGKEPAAYVEKPVSPESFVRIVKRVLEAE